MSEIKANFKFRTERILSAPIMINLELTSGCNARCRHCYNFWRDNSHSTADKINKENMGRLIKMVKQDEVFHVVLTGGEPLLNFNVLEFALKELHEFGISTSVNSNLMLATPEKMRKLKNAGMDHVLTSLNSHVPQVNDYMVNKKGALHRIVQGIKTTVEKGIRVSANMIVSETNKEHVYETAKLCSELGVQKIFATRLVPSVTVENPTETDLKLNRQSALTAIDDLLKAKEDFGIEIGTLISYPLCLLEDLEKYSELVGRGCPAQRGNRMVINADGETHACTHESYSYGNVFDIGIRKAFENMNRWHDGSFLYQECKDCEYINVCGSGCRSAAFSYFKKMNERDPFFMGRERIKNHYKLDIPNEIGELIDQGEIFVVPETIRFRPERGFYTINIRWANAYSVDENIGEFLRDKQSKKGGISLCTMIGKNPRDELVKLIFKETIVPEKDILRKRLESGVKKGCSINPYDLPDAFS